MALPPVCKITRRKSIDLHSSAMIQTPKSVRVGHLLWLSDSSPWSIRVWGEPGSHYLF